MSRTDPTRSLLLVLIPWLAACGSEPDPSATSATTAPTTTAVDGSSGTTTGVEGTSGTISATTSDETITTGADTTAASSGPSIIYDVQSDDPDLPGVDPTACRDTTADALTTFVPCMLPVALVPPYDDDYECWQYVDVPGVPPQYGGMTFAIDDPDLLLIGGAANTAAGQLFAIRVTRDAACNVTGFSEPTAVLFAAAEYNDGGIAYAGDDTLFLARWPVNELGQLTPGAVATSKIIDLTPLGVTSPDSGAAALAFVPGEFPGEGLLKLVSWSAGYWYTVSLLPDGMGTYDVSGVVHETILGGGPEGFVFVADDSPEVAAPSVLVAEWSANQVSIYEIDDDGDPVVDTRALFITGLQGPEGAHIDPVGGNFLFSTFGGGNVLVAIRGFTPNEPPPPPG